MIDKKTNWKSNAAIYRTQYLGALKAFLEYALKANFGAYPLGCSVSSGAHTSGGSADGTSGRAAGQETMF